MSGERTRELIARVEDRERASASVQEDPVSTLLLGLALAHALAELVETMDRLVQLQGLALERYRSASSTDPESSDDRDRVATARESIPTTPELHGAAAFVSGLERSDEIAERQRKEGIE